MLSGLLCDEHARDYRHEDYGEPMPAVNSPRVGLCGAQRAGRPSRRIES